MRMTFPYPRKSACIFYPRKSAILSETRWSLLLTSLRSQAELDSVPRIRSRRAIKNYGEWTTVPA